MLRQDKTQRSMLERGEGAAGMHRPGHTSASCWHSWSTHKDCRRPVILPLLARVRRCQCSWRKRYVTHLMQLLSMYSTFSSFTWAVNFFINIYELHFQTTFITLKAHSSCSSKSTRIVLIAINNISSQVSQPLTRQKQYYSISYSEVSNKYLCEEVVENEVKILKCNKNLL